MLIFLFLQTVINWYFLLSALILQTQKPVSSPLLISPLKHNNKRTGCS